MRPLENTAAESSAQVESSIIRVADVRKSFKSGDEEIEALRGVSFEVPPGACSFFVGPSGSGKSTLLYLLGALDRPSSGTIVIGGQNLTAMNEVEQDVFRRQKIGFVFQQFNLIPNLSAVENVLLPFIPTGLTPDCHTKARGHSPAGRPGPSARAQAVKTLRRPAAAGGHCAGIDQRPGRSARR